MKRQNWVIVGVIVVGWIIFLGQPTAVSARLRALLIQLTTPLVKLGDLIPAIHGQRELARRNEDLRAENDRLRRELQARSQLVGENLRLEKLLSIKDRLPGKPIGARVIGRDASNWWKTLQLDRGSQDGVHISATVCNADGLVGKIVAVTRGESRVLLLVDPNCKASALLNDSRQPGIVAGVDAPFTRSLQLLMTFVDRRAKISGGEAVYTSGLGGIFPKGLLIGTVLGARLNAQSGMYQDIDVKPAVDFQRIEEVLVIVQLP